MLATMFLPSVGFAEFIDSNGREDTMAIEWLQNSSIVQGYSDGSYRPEQNISRAEFLKIAISVANNNGTENPTYKKDCSQTEIKNITNTFWDVYPSDWHAEIICKAYKSGIIKGYQDGSFKPNQTISKAEAAKIITISMGESIPNEGTQWFDPFFSVLKNEKAVDESFITTPHQPLTRGQMADVTWRIATGHEKVASNELQSFGSCNEIISEMQKAVKRGGCWECGGGGGDMVPMMSMADSAVRRETAAKSSEGSSDFSGTNVQEQNVDEADIVKNDGTHIFLAKNDTVKIIKAYPATELSEESSIQLEGAWASEMYLQGNTLVVLGSTSGGTSWGADAKMSMPIYSSGTTDILVYDVTDRKNPKKIRTAKIDGSILSSRITNGTLYSIINAPFYQAVYPADQGGGINALPKADGETLSCTDIRYVPNFRSHQITMVAALDINNPNEKTTITSFLGAGENIYMSEKNLYIVSTDQKQIFRDENGSAKWGWEEISNIFKFGVNKTNITLTAKGEVSGRVLNQYAMSEYDGYFRIASQTGYAWGPEKSDNKVTVLDKDLTKTGEVTGIAKGENIKSARFVGNKGYVVTFKTVDPLFVLDMTPNNPKIEGELKIPGWSNYLHPIDETHILGIGKEVDESIDADKVHDENAVYYTAVQGVKLSMFDVSDVKNPKELYKTVIGERGTETEATYNPKALFIDTNKKLIGFPIAVTKTLAENKCVLNADNTCSKGCIPQCEPCSGEICPAVCKVQCVSERWNANDPQQVFQGAMLFSWGDAGFTKQGEVTNYPESFDFYNSWNDEYPITRLIRIGENFYSISKGFIKALDKNLKVQKELSYISTGKCEDIKDAAMCTSRADCDTAWIAPSCAAGMMCAEMMQFGGCKTK